MDSKHTFKFIPYGQVRLTDEFWVPRERVNREHTLPHIYRQLQQTGRVAALQGVWPEELRQRRTKGDSQTLDEEVAHLFEALGVLHAADATPLVLEYVPKRAGWHLSRGAAIWAIGHLNAGTRDSELEAKLSGRILDFDPQPSESSLVKQMSSIALGRMQAVDQASMLRQYAESDDVEISLQLALGWAVRELTGEILPPPDPATVSQGDWFFHPLP